MYSFIRGNAANWPVQTLCAVLEISRLVAELKAQGVETGAYKVRPVLRKHGLHQPRSYVPRTTDSRHPYPISPNLLLDSPFPAACNQVWVGDITYIPLAGGGFLYLAV